MSLFFGQVFIMSLTIFRSPITMQNGNYTDSWSTELVVTTSDSATVCKEIYADPGLSETYIIDCSFTGYIVSNGQSVFIKYVAMAKNIGGGVEIYNAGNAPMLVIRDGDNTLDACVSDIILNVDKIQIRLFGLPATTINWGISYHIIRYVQ